MLITNLLMFVKTLMQELNSIQSQLEFVKAAQAQYIQSVKELVLLIEASEESERLLLYYSRVYSLTPELISISKRMDVLTLSHLPPVIDLNENLLVRIDKDLSKVEPTNMAEVRKRLSIIADERSAIWR